MEQQKPIIIAHRGAAGEAPENTLASFRLAVEQGCDGIELDVHLSRDGEIIVIHDETVDRTTDGTGAVSGMTLEEIKRLDAGSWFHETFTGERIPTLEEVFAVVPGRVMINVEIKRSETGEMPVRLIRLMKRCDRMASVVVSSFDHGCLLELKRLEPSIRIGLLYHQTPLEPVDVKNNFPADVYSLHPHGLLLTPTYAAESEANGFRVYPWTVNHREDMQKVLAAGVHGIITDFPGRLHTLLNAKVLP